MYTEAEKAYLAGLVDGEGTLAIRLSVPRGNGNWRTHELFLSIANTYIPLLESLKARWAPAWMNIRKNGKWKPIGNLGWAASSAARVLREIRPYMVIKREQCEVALRFSDELAARPHLRGAITEVEWEQRERLRIQLRELNRPGQRLIAQTYPFKGLPPLICAHCGQAFTNYVTRKKKYCSMQCFNRAQWRTRKARLQLPS